MTRQKAGKTSQTSVPAKQARAPASQEVPAKNPPFSPGAPLFMNPQQALQLQRTIGNRAFRRLLSRPALAAPPTHRAPAGMVQTARLPKKDLYDLTLSEFDDHRKAEQFDWANTAGIDQKERTEIWWLLQNAVGPCGDMKVDDLVTARKHLTKANRLESYIEGVTEEIFANDSRLPKTDKVDDGPDPGALTMGKYIHTFNVKHHKALKHIPPSEFGLLIKDTAQADEFDAYLSQVKPTLETENGSESEAFRDFYKEKGDFRTYLAELPEIKNIHKFTVPALKKLVDDKKDKSKTKPLTLILHAMADHNGAFHRHSGVDAAIQKDTLLVLVYEKLDAKTLAAFPKTEFERIAKTYGKGDKITQVMIAGHGSPTLIHLGGPDNIKEMTGDDQKLNFMPLYLDRDKYKGVEKLADFWDGFFAEMFKHMGPTETKAHKFEPRVLLRACLTNANSVENQAVKDRLKKNHGIDYDNLADVTDPAVQKKVEQEVAGYINDHGSLATRLHNKSPKGTFKVVGASASITSGSVGTVYPTGELGFPSKDDPYVDKEKIKYVEFGKEPEGAMRAMVETWAADKKTAHEAMNRRILKPASSYDTYVINLLFTLILDKYPSNLLAANELVSTANALSHVVLPTYQRVKTLTKDKMLGVHHATIIDGLIKYPGVKKYETMMVVLTQYWMLQDNSKRPDFLAAMAETAITMNEAKYVDYKEIDKEVGPLLKLGVHDRGRNLLALFGVTGGNKHKDAVSYLEGIAKGNGDAFPAGITDLLKGSPYSEDDILQAVGLPPRQAAAVVAPAGPKGAVKKTFKPNVDTNGDGKNDAFVAARAPVQKKVTNLVWNARIRETPQKRGKVLYKEGQNVTVVGEVRTLDDKDTGFYAVIDKNTQGLAYTEKDNFD